MSNSDALFDTERRLHECCLDSYTDEATSERINLIRCQMVVLQMEIEGVVPLEWLERNPIYIAASAGDISLHDAYMDGDDSMLVAYRFALVKAFS